MPGPKVFHQNIALKLIDQCFGWFGGFNVLADRPICIYTYFLAVGIPKEHCYLVATKLYWAVFIYVSISERFILWSD